MLPDSTGSDVDYYDRLNPQDPRTEMCEHYQRADSCGRCLEADYRPAVCLHELPVDVWCAECAAAAETMLAEAFTRMLAKIQETEDETKGAALAARFEGNRA
jgi:hypothetical protein